MDVREVIHIGVFITNLNSPTNFLSLVNFIITDT